MGSGDGQVESGGSEPNGLIAGRYSAEGIVASGWEE